MIPATRAQIVGVSQADFIEWSGLFNVGVAIPVGAGLALVTNAMHAFNLTHPALLISRVQGGAASQFNGDFSNGDSVLVTQNTRGPIVLVFDPPITAVGANVQSPVGAAVTMEVWCRGAKKAQPFPGIGVLQHLIGNAERIDVSRSCALVIPEITLVWKVTSRSR